MLSLPYFVNIDTKYLWLLLKTAEQQKAMRIYFSLREPNLARLTLTVNYRSVRKFGF